MTSAAMPIAPDLLADAERETGLHDWGGAALFEPEFRSLFAAMRNSVVDEAQLTEPALAGAQLRLRTMAAARLRLIDDRKQIPDIAAQRIVAPIFILGLPRAGSTFLHNLLSRDPANRAPESWEMILPSPPPRAETREHDPRIALAARVFDGIGLMAPSQLDSHPGGPREAEECHLMMEHVAMGDILPAFWRMPGYNKLRAGIPQGVAYETHRNVLQALQYGMPGRRFVLKNPGYIFHIQTLLSVYPDALLIQTHRDPARVIASVAAQVADMRRVNSDAPLREASIARGNLLAYSKALADSMALRAADAEIDKKFFDVHFRNLIADPIATVRACYDHFGIEFSSAAEARMRAWLQQADNQVSKRKPKLADYGIDEAQIEENYAAYIDHYQIARERPA
jgi:hypothetical protein